MVPEMNQFQYTLCQKSIASFDMEDPADRNFNLTRDKVVRIISLTKDERWYVANLVDAN